ncbi:MAG: prolipoprotein diacylglyceryl transferase family protein [Planctomycetota bacterium]
MTIELFVLALAAIFGVGLYYGFKVLPRERWQVLATLPLRKEEDGSWRGLNFTWYGLLSANAYVIGLALVFFLMGSIHVPHPLTGTMFFLLLLVVLPASKLVARVVERKKHTFTVGGATFAGMLAFPLGVTLANATAGRLYDMELPVLPLMGALGVGYAFGEGLGRLACISFGCCYGKPLHTCHAKTRVLFRRFHFAFEGPHKKASYASGYEQKPLIPIQGITAVLYVTTGLFGTWMFLRGHFTTTVIFTFGITQGWRAVSEVWRDDFRGGQKISAYQWMALIGALGAIVFAVILRAEPAPVPDLGQAFWSVWDPFLLISLQGLWALVMIFMGKSEITTATVRYGIHQERV